ncbi:Glutamate receptor [Zostera marina]|uniref:Glutamate receptor n=1 Tax=Zostera marina TaxID=29655 RepID=A0A0K9P171_ZOSMR|nr:Glutamate receptor [Zostera marina]
MSAIAELVDHYGWDQVIAIYIDDESGRNGIQILGDKLEERRCKISYKAALPPGPRCTKNDITDLLVKLVMMESRVFVLHANPENGMAIFSIANSLGITGNGFVWIATDWLTSVLDTDRPTTTMHMDMIQGVVGLCLHIPESGRRTALLSRWNRLAKEEHAGLNSYALYAYDSVWTIARAVEEFLKSGGVISFSKDSKFEQVAGVSSKLHLESMSVFDGGNLLLNKILKTDALGLTGPIRFDSDRQLVRPAYDIINVVGTGYRKVGYWSNHSGLSVEPPEKLYSTPFVHSVTKRRKSGRLKTVIWPGETTIQPRGWVFPQKGRQMRIGIPYRATYQEFVSKSSDSDTMIGFCVDVFVASVSLLPYAVPYHFVPFGDGRRNPNYNKLVSMVALGEFDAAIGDITIVTNRTKIVDFTQPFMESGLVILAAVKKHDTNTWAFLLPFTPSMWLATAGSLLVIGIVVWILEHRLNDDFRGPFRKQVATIFWFSLSTLFFTQREKMVGPLGRLVVLLWLFIVLIIQSSYTASLTSILTVTQLSSEIKDVESLIRSGDPIGFQVGSFAENYMVDQLGISRSRLRTLDTPHDYANALDLGARNGGVAAIIDERSYVDDFLSTNCNFQIIGSELTKSGWGFAFPRDSPLAIDMSTAILELSENGELQRIHNKWLTVSHCTPIGDELKSDQLHLSSFCGLFFIFGVACALALLLMFCRFYRKYFFLANAQNINHPGPSLELPTQQVIA